MPTLSTVEVLRLLLTAVCFVLYVLTIRRWWRIAPGLGTRPIRRAFTCAAQALALGLVIVAVAPLNLSGIIGVQLGALCLGVWLGGIRPAVLTAPLDAWDRAPLPTARAVTLPAREPDSAGFWCTDCAAPHVTAYCRRAMVHACDSCNVEPVYRGQVCADCGVDVSCKTQIRQSTDRAIRCPTCHIAVDGVASGDSDCPECGAVDGCGVSGSHHAWHCSGYQCETCGRVGKGLHVDANWAAHVCPANAGGDALHGWCVCGEHVEFLKEHAA